MLQNFKQDKEIKKKATEEPSPQLSRVCTQHEAGLHTAHA